MPFLAKVKRCTESLQSGPADLAAMRPFVFLFVEKCAILNMRFTPPSYGRGGESMEHFLTLFVSVTANVVSHFICKWLDR